ncbi:MAG: HAMP domain-containing protein [Polyangiaceae bacterium]|nr:HAMP domain-containing protein [Polyangiaceae bacterium]
MRWPRLSVRGKIMGTIVLVSTVVLALGAWAALDAVRAARHTGRYLEAPFKRYRAGLDTGGTAEYAVVRLLATDPSLVSAYEAGDVAAALTATKRLTEPLQSTVAPRYLTVSDAAGVTLKAEGINPVREDQWRISRLFQDLREGRVIRSKVAIIARQAFRVSGAPIRASDGRVLGAVMIANELEHLFQDIATHSGSDVAAAQHRFSLLADDRVVTSVLPKDDQSALLAAFKAPRELTEGSQRVPVLEVAGRTYDFWSEPLVGYERAADPATNEVGTLLLVKEREDHLAQMRAAYQGVLGIFLAATLVAIIVGYLLAVQITRPLRRYIDATDALAHGQGDLTRRLEVQTRDELGQLAGNLNRVFAKIHGLALGVQRSAFQVNASSGQISAVSRQMHDGAKQQATRISSSTAAVTELSSSIQQVAENAAAATRTAKASGEAVGRAIHRLAQIRRTVEEAAARIGQLGDSGKRIGNIVDVIRQISEQTTMLALNAAIEAAHAGEHGRGFAVVADEVSSLAKRVGQSARDIEDLIATIKDQTGEAVRVMQTGTREVEEGTGLVEATLADLKTLISVIDDTASAVQEQAIASDEIARNMDAVQQIATNVLASSENAVSEGDQLQRLAEELERSVKGFKLDPARATEEAELALEAGELAGAERRSLPGRGT